MLKHRILFGTAMAVLFTAVVIFDGWFDGSLTASEADDRPVQASGLCLLIAALIIPAQRELAGLGGAKGIKIFLPVSIAASILFSTSWYFQQFIGLPAQVYLSLLSVFVFLALLLYQYLHYGTSGVLANCGASCFSVIYLGLFSGFCLAVRIKFGLWAMLMFVSVVKSADIGAYAVGSGFGRRKFSSRLSPGKTWEGMAGAVVSAVIVAVLFASGCDIMVPWLAVVFGICFAFVGQFGDLAESMLKRDAGQKDSSNDVPGFGGVLDIIDSPLFAAPFAYLFFIFVV